MTLLGRLAAACCAVALLPVSSAGAQGRPLPGAAHESISEAGGQLLWTGSTNAKQINLYTRPAAGGATRQLGTVTGPAVGGTTVVSFDGTNYALVLQRVEVEAGDGGDCGVCESDYSEDTQVFVGTLASAPREAFKCSTVTDGGGAPPAVAVVAGRTFGTGLRCAAPEGIVTLDAPGAPAVFDAAGTSPLAGNGTWLAYGVKGATKVTNLAGGGSYIVPVVTNLFSTKPLERALFVQADGSIMLSGAFFRTGGTAAPVPVRTEWSYVPSGALFAGDRLFYRYGSDVQLPLAAGQAPKPIVVAGLAYKRPLALNGSMLNTAGYSCTGVVTLQTVDVDAAAPAGAVDGCPVEVRTSTLKLTAKRTISVKVRCPNGCSGRLVLRDGNDPYLPRKISAPAGGTATVVFRLSRKQAKVIGKGAWFWAESPWLTVDTANHRLKKARQ